jgi:acyl carrier protein
MSKRLAEVLADIFGMRVAEIRPDLLKSEVGTWDSLKQMDLVISLEREYGIALDIPDIVRMTSVASIIDVLKEKGLNLES